ncbi:hypothetical protein ACHQM5_016373 [Ranunculus cassubicifolius]
MADNCRGKNSWPELVGTDGNFAAARIESQNPFVGAVIVLEGTIVPADFRAVCSRVRVWVNTSGIVTRIPAIG